MRLIKLSISIVVYKEDFMQIKKCLLNLFNEIPNNISYQIILVDNGALQLNKNNDLELKIKKFLPNIAISYLISPKNGGYGYGHNQAIFISQADYHLIINSDICIMRSSLKNALVFMENNSAVGVVVPDVYDMSERRIYLCRHNPRIWISFLRRFSPIWFKKIFRKQMDKFEMRDRDYDSPMFNLTNPTGCFMLCRLPILQSIHGFDEKFFMYYEDSDLGRRLARLTIIAYLPSVKIKHEWKRAAYHDKRLAWMAVKAAFYYSWKWRSF
jgi:GT2 family glycosyltransferase